MGKLIEYEKVLEEMYDKMHSTESTKERNKLKKYIMKLIEWNKVKLNVG